MIKEHNPALPAILKSSAAQISETPKKKMGQIVPSVTPWLTRGKRLQLNKRNVQLNKVSTG
jgi:hypothetical protein